MASLFFIKPMIALLSSSQSVMLCALLSSLSRAGLNVVDRYQIGFRKLSIRKINLWNNVVPAFFMMLLSFCFGWEYAFFKSLICWKTILFSGLVQLVAYAFSFAFHHLNVNQVTIAAKLSDVFIPLGIFVTASSWSWSNYSFAVLTTLACLPMLWNGKKIVGLNRSVLCIIGALVLQASLAPLLIAAPAQGANNFRYAFLFTATVLFWRSAWAVVPLFFQQKKTPAASSSFFSACTINAHATFIFLLRVVLTVMTQVFFIAAIGSSNSVVAWPILNSTGLFALFFSKRFLKEHHTWREQAVIGAITFLELVRFFSL